MAVIIVNVNVMSSMVNELIPSFLIESACSVVSYIVIIEVTSISFTRFLLLLPLIIG